MNDGHDSNVGPSDCVITKVLLPPNANLLSTSELITLNKDEKNQLHNYVSRFNPVGTIVNEVEQMKRILTELQQKFEQLDKDKNKVQYLIDECRIYELEYVQKWQDLQDHITLNYGVPTLQGKLEREMNEASEQCHRMENMFITGDDLDEYTEEYLKIKCDYYTLKEKLTSWKVQGKLE